MRYYCNQQRKFICKAATVYWVSLINEISCLYVFSLRPTHIGVRKLTIIVSVNGLSPDRRQAIIWTNAGILLIGSFGTTIREISIDIPTFSLKNMCLKVSSAKRRSFCLGLNVLLSYHMCIRYFWLLRYKLPVIQKINYPSDDEGPTVPKVFESLADHLTHWGRVTLLCVNKLGHHLIGYLVAAYSVPSHYLNQCCLILH